MCRDFMKDVSPMLSNTMEVSQQFGCVLLFFVSKSGCNVILPYTIYVVFNVFFSVQKFA